MNTPDAQRPRSELLRRTVLVLVSVVIGLGLIEIGVRASSWTWLFAWPNYVLDARKVLAERDDGRSVHDDRLGYRPRPGYAAPGITIDGDGLRSTGAAPAGDKPPILAVGDSFTFGEEVGNTESWPADLQRITGRRVLNGGVSGYGFDQIVLRAEALAPLHRPGAIVVAFIADDIRRTEMRRMWSADKPYFDLEGDGLGLRNAPVPPRAPAETTLTFWQRTLGYSYAFDFLMRRLDLLHDWFGDHIRVHPAGLGERISCKLTARLAGLEKSSGAPVLLVAAYDPVVWDDPRFAAEQRRLTEGLLDCARRNGLATLDTYDAQAATPRPRDLYVLWHMNAAGNALMARLIAGALGDKGN
ncbi:GDSL-type esterase/lipase family protein [Reyranella sp.]|jgi:lysophospholipase L1-like esterase|uniref:SGNH/GDSL hydrolase family protein n=1 Tax=Reyranella sp. TaxID=1929291 RepID=UPI002601D258|nr:GDSL-type esterase/lipase family protein [Reyranella sp.]HQS18348.1 GDSL-type esterase/lipase family protein [Reyranella sp.]HQT15082.1 GDSL-type esterase/lipase family protein [Reyranella sp.]